MSSGKKGMAKMAAHVGPNMTPMVDIVMCILIFFMLGSSFLAPELFLTSNMMVDSKGLGTETAKPNIPNVRIQIGMTRLPNDTTLVNGFQNTLTMEDANEKTDPNGSKRKASIDNIVAFLKTKHKEVSNDVQVIIAPGNAVPYQDVISLYDACMQARFPKVAFRAAGT